MCVVYVYTARLNSSTFQVLISHTDPTGQHCIRVMQRLDMLFFSFKIFSIDLCFVFPQTFIHLLSKQYLNLAVKIN